MATDIKKALEDIIELRKEFENDILYITPELAAQQLTKLMMAMQPTSANALDVVKYRADIATFFEEVDKIKVIAEKVTPQSILEYKKVHND